MNDGIVDHNRRAWNRQARDGSQWTTPVDPDVIARARAGDWQVILTPVKPVPAAWFGETVQDRDILCLGSGGGQQAPVLAAAGARVTSLDLSDEQLARDRAVAEREGLDLRCVQGDMRDLTVFPDASFDLVFNPVSTVFVPDLEPVWRECFRVLRPGGRLLTGFMNPAFYLFDPDEPGRTGELAVRFRLPYTDADPKTLTPQRRREIEAGEAMEFSHSLETQIGGQTAVGFHIVGLYEDHWSDAATPLNRWMPTTVATLAVKPA